MKIEVYSKPGCQPCRFVKDHLKRELQSEIESSVVEIIEYDVYEDESALARIKEMGFQGVPVTFIDNHDPIYGFDLGKLDQIISSFKHND